MLCSFLLSFKPVYVLKYSYYLFGQKRPKYTTRVFWEKKEFSILENKDFWKKFHSCLDMLFDILVFIWGVITVRTLFFVPFTSVMYSHVFIKVKNIHPTYRTNLLFRYVPMNSVNVIIKTIIGDKSLCTLGTLEDIGTQSAAMCNADKK